MDAKHLEAWLLGQLAIICELDCATIDPREPLRHYGLDAAAAGRLISELSALLGRRLSPTLVSDHPTVHALAEHLAGSPEPVPAGDGRTRHSAQEPLAVVGMSCRFPGAPDLEAFWDLLARGVDAIVEVPADRWDAGALFDPDGNAPGKLNTRWGGFLERVDLFDPQFFGISPREAIQMDPQQRLMLELAWEALEDAGIPPPGLAESRTGVFVGALFTDYARLLDRAGPEAITAHSSTGGAAAIISNRISYALGLQGPSLTVDTASSSSLVAVHLACQSLRSGESDLALAGGVNLMLVPETTMGLSKLGAMSPDGRSRAFDASASGYVRAEGAGVVTMKRLSDALRDGDRIYAVVRGSAVNSDGASDGLTAPKPEAQQAVLRDACVSAGIAPGDVHYVEAHGSGTPLGDPIEAWALGSVYGAAGPADRRLLIGSVKTNVGHLEAASGIAGFIKVALAMRHDLVPANLHFETPNPNIDFDGLRLEVVTQLQPWPAPEGAPRRAGVSSFGYGGTNSHVIVESPPGAPHPAEARGEARVHFLPVSGQIDGARSESAARLADLVERDPGLSLDDVCYTAGVRRPHHRVRAAVVAEGRAELLDGLRAVAEGRDHASTHAGASPNGEPPKVVFVFSGQGSQWVGMGRQLLAEQPVFRAKLEECDALLRRHVSWSLLEALGAPEERSRLGETEVVQPALFAIQVGLAALLGSWGIRPDGVLGHSIGEVAAAHVAGALSLEEATRLVAFRGQIMQKATGLGKMTWVALPPDEAAEAIASREAVLAIAAVNDPGSVVLSGETTALADVVATLSRRGVECRPLNVNYAFHSPQMDPLARALTEELGEVDARSATVALYSTVTGASITGEALDASYWGRNVRAPVQFASAVASALGDGHRLFLEVGPHPVLARNLAECLAAYHSDGGVLHTLRRQSDEHAAMLHALGGLYVRGVDVDLRALHPAGSRCVSLPPYPWQRERYWIEEGPISRNRSGVAANDGAHPLLGPSLVPAEHPESHYWERWVSASALPYLNDHRVNGEVVFPGAGYVEMALAAGADVYGAGTFIVEDLLFERALALRDDGGRLVQVSVTDEGYGRAALTIASRATSEREWTRHATGRLRVVGAGAPALAEPPSRIQGRCPNVIDGALHYTRMEERGLHHGARFQGVERLWLAEGEALGRVRLPADLSLEAGAYGVHPALLDACVQVPAALLPSSEERALVPVGAAWVRISGRVPAHAWVHARLAPDAGAQRGARAVDLAVLNDDGQIVVEVGGLRLSPLEASDVGRGASDDCLYAVVWRARALPPAAEPASAARPAGAWLIVLDAGGTGTALAACLRARGEACLLAKPSGGGYERLDDERWQLDPTNPAQLDRLLAEAFGRQRACRGVIHCAGMDAASAARTSVATLQADLRRGTLAALRIAQAILRQGFRNPPRLVLVTRGAQAVTNAPTRTSFAQAPLWGLGRTIALEHPELECARVDLPAEPLPDDADLLARELVAGDGEDQIALRAEGRFVARLARTSLDLGEATVEHLEPAAGRAYRLTAHESGVLSRLSLREVERRPPGPGEVEIEVNTAGLGFLDVMKATGVYPGLPPGPSPLGVECAGTVVAVGAGVTGLELGREVIAAAVGGLASHVTVPAAFVVPKGARLSFAQASTLPLAFMTVYWALRHVARLSRGERILIHSASGGVGLAAIQYARAVGAEVFATAGGEEKQELLRSLGVEHVMDSRTLAFADEVLAATGGRGVDVVLNSLEGDALVKSLEVLAPYGRFLELGKRDIYQNSRVGLLPFRKCLSYTAIDLAGMALEKPDLYAALLREVVERFEDGTFTPLPVEVFAANDAVDAFRRMAEARHVGKIAVRMSDPEARVATGEARHAGIAADGSYLITGGLGGLGLHVARWMVSKGARHLALVGRSAPTDAARDAIRALEEAGAEVCVLRGDVSRPADVDSILGRVADRMPPLRGVVHAAGALEDRALVEMSEEQFWTPIRPKVLGAWNLHAATAGLPLDFFVMYSSATVLLGSPGQGNYVAANAFLDALSRARAAEGLPAASVQWGPFADPSAASTASRGQKLSHQGMGSITPDEGAEVLSHLLQRPRAELGVVRLSVRQWVESHPPAALAPFLQDLREREGRASVRAPVSQLREALAALPLSERRATLERHVLECLGRVLRLAPDRIDPHLPFKGYGMDSMMSVEVRNRLESSVGLVLSPTLLFTYPTTAALVDYLLFELQLEDAGPAEPTDGSLDGTERHAMQLSEEAAVAMLHEKLLDLEDYLR